MTSDVKLKTCQCIPGAECVGMPNRIRRAGRFDWHGSVPSAAISDGGIPIPYAPDVAAVINAAALKERDDAVGRMQMAIDAEWPGSGMTPCTCQNMDLVLLKEHAA